MKMLIHLFWEKYFSVAPAVPRTNQGPRYLHRPSDPQTSATPCLVPQANTVTHPGLSSLSNPSTQ